MKRILTNLPTLLKLSYQGWKEDKASRLSAALAYYTIFSLAPLLVIIIAITALFWQREVVQSQVMNQVEGLVGAEGRTFVSDLVTSASNPARGIFASIVGVVTLLIGALGVFFSHAAVFVLAGAASAMLLSELFAKDRSQLHKPIIASALWAAVFAGNYWVFLRSFGKNQYLFDYWNVRGAFFRLPPRSINPMDWVDYAFAYVRTFLTTMENPVSLTLTGLAATCCVLGFIWLWQHERRILLLLVGPIAFFRASAKSPAGWGRAAGVWPRAPVA